jgi:hypothetical protein
VLMQIKIVTTWRRRLCFILWIKPVLLCRSAY